MFQVKNKFSKIYKIMKNRHKTRKDINKVNAGFSFVETLAVLAVTAIFAAQVGAAAFKLVDKSRVTATRTQIENLKVALQTYYIDCGSFPSTEQGLNALWQKPEFYPIPENWNGPYIDKKIEKDSWGNPFIYKKNGDAFPSGAPENAPFVIMSLGANGEYGGEKNDVDIVSWE